MSTDTWMQRLRAWIQKQPTGATGGGTHVGIGLLDKALADERERCRNAVLAEVCKGLAQQADAARREGEEDVADVLNSTHDWVLSLKSPPREVLCEHGAGEGVECRACHPPIETASEDNGLLPKSRRREHQYGRAKHTVKRCRRPGCTASSRPGYVSEMYRARDIDAWSHTEPSCEGT